MYYFECKGKFLYFSYNYYLYTVDVKPTRRTFVITDNLSTTSLCGAPVRITKLIQVYADNSYTFKTKQASSVYNCTTRF